jgi:hypothetical protein
MAFIDDARHSAKNHYASSHKPLPRQYYTLAALGTSLLIWAVVILAVLRPL